eukprot:14475722-Ditylum_brightwellii.AAC.1
MEETEILDEEQENEVINNRDVVRIDEDQCIYDSDYDAFCEESFASVVRIEESCGKGVEIFTKPSNEQTCSIAHNWQEEDLTHLNKMNLNW